jgi:hypothetical protein
MEHQHPQQNSVILQQQQQQQQYCSPQISSRNLFWNFTRSGQLARQPCPEGSGDRWVSWLCDPERLRFVPALSPDFTQCQSTWLARLNQQLYQMLEVPTSRQQLSPSARQQDEQMIKSILGELSLLTKTKELFSGDLRRIDDMINQMIAQLKSASNLAAANPAAAPINSYPGQTQLVSIYSEMFAQLASICSSLFDSFQRNAWLELPSAEARRHLEARLLNHLKEAGLMFAQSLTPDQLVDMQPIRQPNVVAGISVIMNNQLRPMAAASSPEKASNELNLSGRLYDDNNGALLSSDDNNAGFKLSPQLLTELAADGK